MSDDLRPITLQVSAIGGEGGGVLSGWIVAAAQNAGFPVQSTSIPGVAQRTGATVYYLEVFPIPITDLDGKRPIMALYPGVGDIDIMLASEFAEAGRAIANGFITPDRTHLIASTHRVYSIGERSDMGDGRYENDKLFDVIRKRSKQAFLGDFREVAQTAGVSLNAVLLGILASIERLPMSKADYEIAIKETGIAVEPNLRGFEVGLAYKFSDEPQKNDPTSHKKKDIVKELESRIYAEFQNSAHQTLIEAVYRLTDYQDEEYASLYLNRMAKISEFEKNALGKGTLTIEAGRHLALWMTYEDVIRVAQLKSDPKRFEKIRSEVGAKPEEPIQVIDFFKPGIEEICSILPNRLGRAFLNFAKRRDWNSRAYLGLHLKSTSIFGYLRLRLLAGLRRWRRGTYKFNEEQANIETWLKDIQQAINIDVALAQAIVECARLVKGYGDTHQRGFQNFTRIREKIILPALSGAISANKAVDALSNASVAALGDPENDLLDSVFESIEKQLSGT